MLAKGSRQLSIMAMNPEVYHLFARACPYILIWLMGFLALTIFTLMVRAYRKQENIHRDTMVGGELPGIPLVLMHSVCFGYSCFLHDWLSALIFGWWGPGFLVIATLVVAKRQVNWQKIARATSVTCKLNYLLLVGLFFNYGDYAPIFAYSLWIMHDQVRLAWLQHNADRTRRVFEDGWIPRICYPLFLFIPFVDSNFPFRWVCAAAASMVCILWLWGLLRLIKAGFFREKPQSFTANLRDIVYLTKS